MANLIQNLQRPALIISHNKTLAAQLYSEFKAFFPENAVEYFVSYYDYYQPEAYVPSTDTFIEKDSSINEEIERLRLAATGSLISRNDVIVIASVSCLLIIIVVVEGEIILLLIVLKTEVHQCRHPLFIVAVHLDQFDRAPLRSECGVYVFSSLHLGRTETLPDLNFQIFREADSSLFANFTR